MDEKTACEMVSDYNSVTRAYLDAVEQNDREEMCCWDGEN